MLLRRARLACVRQELVEGDRALHDDDLDGKVVLGGAQIVDEHDDAVPRPQQLTNERPARHAGPHAREVVVAHDEVDVLARAKLLTNFVGSGCELEIDVGSSRRDAEEHSANEWIVVQHQEPDTRWVVGHEAPRFGVSGIAPGVVPRRGDTSHGSEIRGRGYLFLEHRNCSEVTDGEERARGR